MSYNSEVKEEIIQKIPLQKCCLKAQLSALIKAKGAIHLTNKGLSLELAVSDPHLAKHFKQLVSNVFPLKTKINFRRFILSKKANFKLTIPPQNHLKQDLNELSLINENYLINEGIPKQFLSNSCCQNAYLRGVFLAAGYILNPQTGYFLEIGVENLKMAKDLKKLFAHAKIKTNLRKHKGNLSIYVHDLDSISKALITLSAKKAFLDLENQKIVKEIRNTANRSSNLETSNVNKVIKSSFEQIYNIKLIRKKIGLSKSSPSLKEISEIRLQYPNASLKELAKKMKVSKSAVNHRFRRIKKIAEKINF